MTLAVRDNGHRITVCPLEYSWEMFPFVFKMGEAGITGGSGYAAFMIVSGALLASNSDFVRRPGSPGGYGAGDERRS